MIHTVRLMVMRNARARRRRAETTILGAFLLGGVAGGALLGLVVAGVASVLGLMTDRAAVATTAGLAGVVALGYAAHSFGLVRLPRPQLRHQVPEAWRNTFSPGAASFVYSGALGVSVFTKIPSTALYPLIVLTLGWADAALAVVAIFASAGLVRAATALLVPLRGWAEIPGEQVTTIVTTAGSAIGVYEGVILLVSGVSMLVLSVSSA